MSTHELTHAFRCVQTCMHANVNNILSEHLKKLGRVMHNIVTKEYNFITIG